MDLDSLLKRFGGVNLLLALAFLLSILSMALLFLFVYLPRDRGDAFYDMAYGKGGYTAGRVEDLLLGVLLGLNIARLFLLFLLLVLPTLLLFLFAGHVAWREKKGKLLAVGYGIVAGSVFAVIPTILILDEYRRYVTPGDRLAATSLGLIDGVMLVLTGAYCLVGGAIFALIGYLLSKFFVERKIAAQFRGDVSELSGGQKTSRPPMKKVESVRPVRRIFGIPTPYLGFFGVIGFLGILLRQPILYVFFVFFLLLFYKEGEKENE